MMTKLQKVKFEYCLITKIICDSQCHVSFFHHIFSEQQIIFYNDGHLCDEMGNLILLNASNSTQRVAKRRLFSPVGDRTPPESRGGQDGSKGPEGGSKSESPDESLHSIDSDDWWHRLLYLGLLLVD